MDRSFLPDPLTTLVAAADEALYSAKESGRDRLACFTDAAVTAPVTALAAPASRLDAGLT